MKIKVYSSLKNSFLEERELFTTPLERFYPKTDIIFVDEHPDERLDLGKKFLGYDLTLAAGSGVKSSSGGNATFIGLKHDLGANIYGKGEDVIRFQRWMLAQGWFGSLFGNFDVATYPHGTILPNGLKVTDGFGYIRRDLAESGFDEARKKIELGDARGSSSFWQRLDWMQIKDEIKPKIKYRLEHLTDAASFLQSFGKFDFKNELFKIEPLMLEHPYIALALDRATTEYMVRLATTAPVNGKVRLAVPTSAPKVAVKGKAIIIRYPIDSWGNIAAIDGYQDDDEIDRIANLEVIQHSFSSPTVSVKGCVGVVDDIPHDIIFCEDDVKMGAIGGDAMMTFNMWFAKGSAMGVSSKWAKDRMGLDHDGDMIEYIDCEDLPATWNNVASFPVGESPKLKKTTSPLSKRQEIIEQMRFNLVGMASNIASMTFATVEREFLAYQLGYQSVAAMDRFLNYAIKAGTDCFKTTVDTKGIVRSLSVMQNSLIKMGITAPWNHWDNGYWFSRDVPYILDEVISNTRVVLDGHEVTLSSKQMKGSITPMHDGTVAQIARLTIPYVSALFKDPIKVRPLKYFKEWASVVSQEQIMTAKLIQNMYSGRARRLNWTDPNRIQELKTWLGKEVTKWIEREGIEKYVAACALWRVAHEAKGDDNQAASVFLAFPDEVLEICERKGGAQILHTVLVGVQFQIPNLEKWEGEVEIREHRQHKGNREIIRLIATGEVPGRVENKEYPDDLIGFIARTAAYPACGKYRAIIRRDTEAAWKLILS